MMNDEWFIMHRSAFIVPRSSFRQFSLLAIYTNMMTPPQIPVIAIVGRPNVGKSSLFNWLAGRRIAIVEPTAGVTRDRLTALIQADDQFLELIDTGGMEMKEGDALTPHVERQIKAAIDQADVILFVVDVRAGLMPLDEAVA